MKSLRNWILLCLMILLSSATALADKPWTEVRSPHFRVLTNGSLSDARHVAREFEQMRYVFATGFPKFRLDSGAPLTIFVPGDDQTAKELDPRDWKKNGRFLSGATHLGWDKQYAMVQMGLVQRLNFSVDGQNVGSFAIRYAIYASYVQSILHMNIRWLPRWLLFGLQQFYGYTQFAQYKIYLGGPPPRLPNLPLSGGPPIPVETLVSDWNPVGDIEVAFFPAESWALVHYLILGPGMGQGTKLSQFLELIESGMPQRQAFQQIFGGFPSIDRTLDAYMRQSSFNTIVIPNPPQIDENTFAVNPLTMAQTYAELAGYHLWTHDLKDARALVAKALQCDSHLGYAHELQGYIYFHDGDDNAAEKEFTRAFALDPRLYLSLFAKTMLSPAVNLATAADQKAFHDAMEQVAAINLEFAPVYVQMARLAVRQGDLKRAYGLSRRAEELEPGRAGYHLMTAEILLQMGNRTEAAGYAAYIAKHWKGPDRDQAIELWNRIPMKEHPAGVKISDETPHKTQTATGTVQSVICGKTDANGQKQHVTLILLHDGKPLTFTTDGKFEFGYSDTFWWGRDHASVCHHLDGLRAVVRYKPSSNATLSGKLTEIRVLDDLPAIAAVKAAAPQTAAQ